MSALVSVPEFRGWAGVAVGSVPDDLIEDCLAEAESGTLTEVGTTVDAVQANPDAVNIAAGEVMRRANRLLARRNSPEGVVGAGSDGLMFTVPVRDADSQRAVWQLQSVLAVPEGVA